MDDWQMMILGLAGVFTAGVIWMIHLDRELGRLEGRIKSMREEINALRERLRND